LLSRGKNATPLRNVIGWCDLVEKFVKVKRTRRKGKRKIKREER
jgi:hypothetical protein